MTKSAQMQRLEAVLAAYGADPARWPEEERSALQSFIAANPEARRRADEEAAFDRLLAAAPGTVASGADSRARAALFAALDGADDSVPAASGNVVPFARKTAAPAVPAAARSMWKELSVMAASLLVGFFTVSQGLLEGSRLDPAQLTVSASEDPDDAGTLALGAIDGDAAEEELL
jgi:hypothetical protein